MNIDDLSLNKKVLIIRGVSREVLSLQAEYDLAVKNKNNLLIEEYREQLREAEELKEELEKRWEEAR